MTLSDHITSLFRHSRRNFGPRYANGKLKYNNSLKCLLLITALYTIQIKVTVQCFHTTHTYICGPLGHHSFHFSKPDKNLVLGKDKFTP